MKNIKFSIRNKVLIVSPIINSDREKILSIILNLITNALKFAPNGNILLRIKHNNACIVFKVKDTGCGISSEVLS